MSVFRKIGRAVRKGVKLVGEYALPIAGTIIGSSFGTIGAAIGGAIGLQAKSSVDQASALRKSARIEKQSLLMQEQALAETKQEQAAQKSAALIEQERLSREEGEKLRANKRRGRRSLVQNDLGVLPDKRKTLG